MKKLFILLIVLVLASGCVQQTGIIETGKPGEGEMSIVTPGETGLPECTDQKYTVPIVDLNEIDYISVLGNLNPPAHTIPTDHMYFHLPYGSGKYIELRAPGDVYITSIAGHKDLVTGDFSIFFALCKDVYGYFIHVKKLSEGLKSLVRDIECERWSDASEERCTRLLEEKVDAGFLLGEVGGEQGNFDFGTYDYRVTLGFVNPSRFGPPEYKPRSLHIVCPLDYYDDASEFYEKISRTQEPRCGVVMQDIAGTLQGNWYHGDATNFDPDSWRKSLAFVHENDKPEQSVISIGGVFTDSGRWLFTERESGQINRKFADVTADGKTYCYQAEIPTFPQDPLPSGRIIVQLTSGTELKIEHQNGNCGDDGSYEFTSPTTYER